MSSADTLINQFIAAAADNGNGEAFSGSLADLFVEKKLSLLELIKALGPTLTSDDLSTRSHSVHCLSATLKLITAKTSLTKQDVCVLVQFLASKLEDEKSTVHVLGGLASLAQTKAFIPHLNGNLETVLNALTSKYEPRKHLAKVRYEAFALLSVLFENHSDNIVTSPEYANLFVATFVHVATSEKDPRNLLMSFRLNSAINKKVTFEDRSVNKTHDQLLTDLFGVSFCYFPISFTPPANDPYKITAAELKAELRATIASQSQFAQDTFPSLFEKLTSTNPAVRNDVVQTLFLCVTEYSTSTIEEYWITIWDSLKFEILHNDMLVFKPDTDYIVPPNAQDLDDTDDNKTLIFTLMTLSAIVQKFVDAESDLLQSVITTVLEGLKPNYSSLNDKTLKQAVLLMTSMASVSSEMFDAVVETLFSFDVWGKYIRSDFDEMEKQDQEDEVDVALTVAKQRELIDNLGFVFSAHKVLNKPNKLIEYKDHLLIFMGQLLQTSSKLEKTLKCKLTQQLVKLMSLNDFLTHEDVTLVLGWLSENLSAIISGTSNWESDILLIEITKGLVHIMSDESEESINSHVTAVVETVLPTLLDNTSEPGVLDLISKLCANYKFLEVLSIRFLNKLAYDDYDSEVYANIVSCLIKSFVQTQSVKPFLTNTWYDNFVPRFLSATVKKSQDDYVVLELSGRLLGLIIRYIEKSKHQKILEEMVPLFMGKKEYAGVSVDIFLNPTPKVCLFKHLLSKIDRTSSFPCDVKETVDKCIALSAKSSSEFVSNGYLQVLSLMVNKFIKQNDSSVDELLSRHFKESEQNVQQLEVSIWILKGLVNRIDAVSQKYVDSLVEQLLLSPNHKYCTTIIKSFDILMADLDIFMNTENSKAKIISGVMNLNVKLLYKQQIFEYVLPQLISAFGNASDENKREICLGMLATMLNNVSTKILKPHLKDIFPLVLDGLTYENASILKASLQTFKVIIYESPDLILENLGSLVTKLISLVTSKIIVNKKLVNNEQIRLLSLDCLEGLFIKLDLGQVVKYQTSTRNQLSMALDDPKRSVRKKTCDVRQMLFELGR